MMNLLGVAFFAAVLTLIAIIFMGGRFRWNAGYCIAAVVVDIVIIVISTVTVLQALFFILSIPIN